MIRLGQEHVSLMHVSIPPDKRGELIDKLHNNKDLKSLNIRASSLLRRKTGTFEDTVAGFKIHCVGEDRTGMLAEIAEAIARRNMSIEDVQTEIRRGNNNTRDFVINAEVVTTYRMDQEDLDSVFAEFQELKQQLNLSVVDIRVHM